MITIRDWLQDLVNVTDEELDFINEITETISVKANEVVIKQGQISNKVGFLAKGAMLSYYTDRQGNDKVVSFVFEGQPLILVGSFISQTPSSVTAVTLEPSEIIWTDYERYTSFMHKFPRYNTVFIEGLAKWMAQGKDRMEYLNQSSAKAKYEMMCKIDPQIIQRVPLKYIASYFGITQETLSRVRGKK
jgi:CRP-like cAMP-binding protein